MTVLRIILVVRLLLGDWFIFVALANAQLLILVRPLIGLAVLAVIGIARAAGTLARETDTRPVMPTPAVPPRDTLPTTAYRSY